MVTTKRATGSRKANSARKSKGSAPAREAAADSGGGLMKRRDFSDQESVSCEVCEREVPGDEAKSVEGRDTVWYFCGLDCYEEWRRLAENR